MPEKICITNASADETMALGRKLGEMIDRPFVIALTGDLGSGKTVLIQGLAEGLGIPPTYPVTSPTFTLINEYEGRFRLFHVDLYRLQGPVDAEDLGLYDILSGKSVTAIEWAERLGKEDFSPDLSIDIQSSGENERMVSLFFYGPETASLVEGIKRFSQQ